MNVKDLQHFLASLSGALSASGAKQVADQLQRIGSALGPFQEWPLAAFGDFLVAAEQYHRTGTVPAGAKGRASTRKAASADGAEALAAAGERLRGLYEGVSSPEVTYQAIQAEVKRLDKFNKDAVFEIARALGISGNLKTKKAALAEIERRLTDRKESFERTRF